jgi:lipopolysaccharide biosynthesis glycosyltransferase
VNHILYIDADTVFLTPVEDVWKEIHNDLEKKHFLGATKERELDEDPSNQAKTQQMAYGSPVPHVGNSGIVTSKGGSHCIQSETVSSLFLPSSEVINTI